MASLGKLHDPLLHWFNSHSNSPVAIILDFFLGWTQGLATSLQIPRVAFFASGAFLGLISDHIWNNVEQVKSSSEVEFGHLPGSHIFKQEHLPSLFKLHKRSDQDSEFVNDGIIANTNSWGCVFNSFDALEAEYVQCLKTLVGHNHVFAVGPLSSTGLVELSGRGNSGSDLNDRVLTWLDRCPDGSVVYVCFGSQKLLRKEQMEALANGLERSGTRFVWVVKSGTTTRQQDEGYGVVPDGFEQRVADRGLVIKGWVAQALILNHKAVGGFVSHCGWNSVLEAIVGGVMMLGWPMEADQYVNASLLVDDMGVAVRVCEGADLVPDSEELGRAIACAMSEGGGTKSKAKDLREEALAAVCLGGSSMKDLDRFVEELSLGE